MSRTMSWLWVASLSVGLAGCGKTYEGDERFPVSGKVSVDGKPLDLGVIAFMPKGGANGAGRVAGAPIRDGIYSVPEENGPTAATYRIQIHWNKRTGKKIPNPMDPEQLIDELTEGLPEKYHRDSELTAEVSADKTQFDFDLQSQ